MQSNIEQMAWLYIHQQEWCGDHSVGLALLHHNLHNLCEHYRIQSGSGGDNVKLWYCCMRSYTYIIIFQTGRKVASLVFCYIWWNRSFWICGLWFWFVSIKSFTSGVCQKRHAPYKTLITNTMSVSAILGDRMTLNTHYHGLKTLRVFTIDTSQAKIPILLNPFRFKSDVN